METVECEACKRTIFLVEKSDEFSYRGELSLVVVCPNPKCKAKTRLDLLAYGAKAVKH